MSHRLPAALTASLVLTLTLALAGPAAADIQQEVDYTYPAPGTFLLRLIGQWASLSGRELNGAALNSKLLDGRSVAGVSRHGVTLDGKPAGSVSLQGSRFGPASGADLFSKAWLQLAQLKGKQGWSKGKAEPKRGWLLSVDAQFTATLDDGDTLPLRIDGVSRGSDKDNDDIYYYDVSYLTQQGWQPLCGVDGAGEAVPAIPLAGRWDLRQGVAGGGDHIDDPDAFTFGCVGFVLAKCVEAGYRPWAKALSCQKGSGCQMSDLSAHHQACTRLMRADYCGDGTSHTADGTAVNLYDALGLRADSADWELEAEWDEDGAVCANHQRLPAAALMSCQAALQQPGCGDPGHFQQGTLLISESVDLD